MVRCPSCDHRWTLANVTFSSGQTLSDDLAAVETIDRGDSSSDPSPQSRRRSSSEPSVGQIGRFELKEALGGGAFGVVYRAWDPSLRRMVAVKVPRFGLDDKRKFRRFLNEAHAAAKLHHPNIVSVYESGQAGDKAFIASEYVEGASLSAHLSEQRPSFREAVEWVRSLADALGYAHRQGIVHRDVKPDNIMLGPEGRPQLLDFGLAKLSDDDSHLTGDGSVLGTPAYMSPEQARGDTAHVGPHSDQYSLGVVLYELLTGQRPFEGPPHSVIAQVAAQEPPAPRQHNGEIPQDLEAICQTTMEKDPAERYADMHAMADDLTRWLDGRETLARPLSLWEKGCRWYNRNPATARYWVVIASLVVLLAISSTIGFVHTTIVLNEKVTALEDTRAQLDALTEPEPAAEDSFRLFFDANKVPDDIIPGILPSPVEKGEFVQWQVETVRPRSPIDSVSWSPDGRLIACVTLNRDVRVYRADGFELVNVFNTKTDGLPGHSLTRGIVRWSPNGRLLAISCEEIYVRLWDVEGHAGPVLRGMGGIVSSIAWNPNGESLLVASSKLGLWSINGSVLREFETNDSDVRDVSWHPDGQRFVSANRDGMITLWNSDGTKKKEVPNPVGPKTWVAWSPDGEQFASGGGDGTVRLWNADGQLQSELHGQSSRVHCLSWSPDGQWLASAGDDAVIRLWMPDGTEGPVMKGNSQQITALDWDKTGQWLVTASDRTMRIWNAEGKAGPVLEGLRSHMASIAWSSNGRWIGAANADGTVTLWNSAGTQGRVLPGHLSNVDCVDWSPDGSQLASASRDATVRIWQIDGTNSRVLKPTVPVNIVKWAPDGQAIAAMGHHGVNVWKRADSSPTQLKGHTEYVNSLAWHPDSQTLATCSDDQTVRLWRGPKFTPLVLNGHTSRVLCLSWSADGSRLASGSSDRTIRLWSPEGQLVSTLEGHATEVSGLAWNPAGTELASASPDATVRIWNADGTAGPVLIGHQSVLGVIAWDPTGNLIASTSGDATMRIWSRDGTVKHVLHDIQGVSALAWAPDGKKLACGRSDGTNVVVDALSGKVDWAGIRLGGTETISIRSDGKFLSGGSKTIESNIRFGVLDRSGQRKLLTAAEFARRTNSVGE
jgi:WD40 repeat protein/predicted Ser/Thr protein kinase